MFWLLGLGALTEFLLFAPAIWRLRRPIAVISILTTLTGSLWLVAIYRDTGSLLILLASVYRAINLMRLLESKMHARYLHRVALRSSLLLLCLQLFIAGVWALFYGSVLTLNHEDILLIIATSQLLIALAIVLSTIRNLRKMAFTPSEAHFSTQELPSVTVGIPARNETDELRKCIESVIASDYPKLEILVLDDCSQDRTAEIIRSYAHEGVRFIHGNEPKENWLAKNQAYDQLADEANGAFIIFLGADTHIGARTISNLITLALSRNKQMISVLPKRDNQGLKASLIQPMRYWWELALPRRLFNRPAVLSTLWMIDRSVLQAAGGFDSVSRSVIPESYFAHHLVTDDAYSFIRSGAELSVMTSKNFREQYERAIRFRYPEFHRRLELVFLMSVLEIAFLLLPFILAIVGIFVFAPAAIIAGIACGLLIISQYQILSATSTRSSHFALINFILAVIVEIFVSNYSMYKYEFSEVDWKGRNICIPVMHTIPRLPEIK